MNKRLIIATILLFSFLTTTKIQAQSGKQRAGEFLIDTNVVYVPAAYDQASPRIATDDTIAFIVWYDIRNDMSWDIYGSRIDADGNLLDPAGILIANAGSDDPNPDVAFDGTNYLVVWHYNESGNPYNIYGTRVSKQGNVLDAEPFIISDAAGAQMFARAAFDGTNYLVVWYDSRSGSSYDIYGTRVAQNGTVLNPAGISISTAANYQYFPDLSFDGNNYMVVWMDERSDTLDIYGSRVAQNGIVLDPAGIQISTAPDEQGYPTIGFDGTNYFVAWDDGRSGSAYDIYGTRVDTNGTVLNPAGIAISTSADDQRMPSVSFDGSNYLATWHDRRDGANYDIFGARVNQSGVVQETSGIHISDIDAAQLTTAVISYSGQWLTVWRDNRNGGYADIYGSRISASGTVTDPSGILISASAQTQGKPAVTSDGTNYLVVWQEDRGGGPPFDIYGMRIDASGRQLDEDAIPISTSTGSQEHPAVAFDNDSIYLVVWQDNRSGSGYDIYGARVTKSGNLLDPPGISISTATGNQRFPSVAFDGTNFLVVWADERAGSSVDDIYGTLVEPNSIVVSPAGNIIADDANWQDNPSIAFDGTNYLVVWGNYASGSFNADIYGVRVNQSGYPVDGTSFSIMTDAYGQWYPVVDFDGTNYMVAWEDCRNDNIARDIYGTRVASTGTVLDASGFPILELTGRQQYPFIVFDGNNYLVGCYHQSDSVQNVFGAAVDTSGAVTDTFAISPLSIKQYQPNFAAARGSGTQLLIIFPDWTNNINGNPSNAIRMWGKIRLAAGVEEDDNIIAKNGKFDLKVSPNITQGICNITFVNATSTPVKLKLFNTPGILLSEKTVGTSAGFYELNLDMSNLPNGTYFINLSSNNLNEKQKVVLIK